MDVSLYSAASAMNATERWQDLVAENLNQASIPGARQREVSFSAVQAGLSTASGLPGGHYVLPSYGSTINFTQGELKATGKNLDLAVEGPGFFALQMPDGSKSYTRDGEFRLNSQGQLVSKQGYPVATDSGTLQFEANNSAPINISPEGEVTQGSDIKGMLSITEFKDMKALAMSGSGLFTVTDPVKAEPTPAAATTVRQGFIEASNTSPTLAMASLINASRMFETNQKVMQMQNERMGKAITELSGTN